MLDHKWQNRMLLVASYMFYGTWDWRFLFLLATTSIIDYYCGIKIDESEEPNHRRLFLITSLTANLGMLGFFKYYNFFSGSLQALLLFLGVPVDMRFLHIILPLGISFYTFQSMSYVIDVYRKDFKPTKDLFSFLLFVSFFPHLVAGPIMRARTLLMQVFSEREITLQRFYEGSFLIFWGIFQKMFVADNLARIVDPLFANKPPYNGSEVLIALYAFTFQVFCDFAGYSNMARGLGKLMGFELAVNFRNPLLSTNPVEFWNRWHISLSTWFRDYVYGSLRRAKGNSLLNYRNIAITWTLVGLWHGAAWTFVIWGAYWAFLLIVYSMMKPLLKLFPSPKDQVASAAWLMVRMFFFFNLSALAGLLFRAVSLKQIGDLMSALINNFKFSPAFAQTSIYFLFFISFLMLMEIFQYVKNDQLTMLGWPRTGKAAFIIAAICLVLYVTIFGRTANIGEGQAFIYFQF